MIAKKMRILVPIDGSPESEAMLPVAARLAEFYEGELLLVRLVQVIDAFGPYQRDDITRMVEETRAYLHDLVYRWELPVERTQCLVNHTDNAAKEIIHLAKATESTLVIMASHGRKGTWGWLRGGSVCDKVVRARVCPTVVVPAEGGDWYALLAPFAPTDAIAKMLE